MVTKSRMGGRAFSFSFTLSFGTVLTRHCSGFGLGDEGVTSLKHEVNTYSEHVSSLPVLPVASQFTPDATSPLPNGLEFSHVYKRQQIWKD